MRPTNVPRPLWPRAVWGCRRGWGRGDCRPGTLPPWEGTRTGTSLRLSGDPSPYGTGSLKHCPAIHLPCFLFIRGLPFPSPIFPFLLLRNPFHLTFTQHPPPSAPPVLSSAARCPRSLSGNSRKWATPAETATSPCSGWLPACCLPGHSYRLQNMCLIS